MNYFIVCKSCMDEPSCSDQQCGQRRVIQQQEMASLAFIKGEFFVQNVLRMVAQQANINYAKPHSLVHCFISEIWQHAAPYSAEHGFVWEYHDKTYVFEILCCSVESSEARSVKCNLSFARCAAKSLCVHSCCYKINSRSY